MFEWKENIRCMSSEKKEDNRNLNFREIEGNNHHGTDRVIIENYFGRLGKLWKIFGKE